MQSYFYLLILHSRIIGLWCLIDHARKTTPGRCKFLCVFPSQPVFLSTNNTASPHPGENTWIPHGNVGPGSTSGWHPPTPTPTFTGVTLIHTSQPCPKSVCSLPGEHTLSSGVVSLLSQMEPSLEPGMLLDQPGLRAKDNF